MDLKGKQLQYFKFTLQFESFLNSDFKDYLNNKTEDQMMIPLAPPAEKFKELKNVKEMQFLLNSYNQLAENQMQLSVNMNKLTHIQGNILDKRPEKTIDMVERLQRNIENLDIFIKEQTEIFQRQ